MVRRLSFREVDCLGFASASAEMEPGENPGPYAPSGLGPLLELLHLDAGGRLSKPPDGGSWLALNGATPLVSALFERHESWLSPGDRRMGFIRTQRSGPDADNRFMSFLIDARTAAHNTAGLPSKTSLQLVAAMEELENNIREHSDAVETGLLAFRAAPGIFEFVAADRGMGILKSLQRCTTYATVPDHGEALQAALTEGTSRFGIDCDRGHGFRPLFLGLANLQGSLRFRSGDHALIMDGTSPDLTTAQLAQKPQIDGFFASVLCHGGVTTRV